MKKVLVLTAVLCLAASMSQASTVESWLTVDNLNPNVGQTFNVSIWVQVVPNANIPGESITDSGIESMAASIYQQNPRGDYAVIANAVNPSHPSPKNQLTAKTTISSTWDGIYTNGEYGIAAARHAIDGTYWYKLPGGTYTTDALATGAVYDHYVAPDGSADGDFDALQASVSTSGNDMNVGVGAPVLLATEAWTCLVKGQASLHETLPMTVSGNASRHWNPDFSKSYFTQGLTGTMVNGVFTPGTDLVLNQEIIPEPITMTMFVMGLSGLGIMIRRRTKEVV